MAITVERFAARHPVLLHMAHRESWPSIRKHGLLSTSALLELFGIAGEDADSIRSTRRAKSIEIHHPAWGSATIRDQKPMTDSGLNRALTDDLRPRDWYRILNSKVFFWPSEGTPTTNDGGTPISKAGAYRARDGYKSPAPNVSGPGSPFALEFGDDPTDASPEGPWDLPIYGFVPVLGTEAAGQGSGGGSRN